MTKVRRLHSANLRGKRAEQRRVAAEKLQREKTRSGETKKLQSSTRHPERTPNAVSVQ